MKNRGFTLIELMIVIAIIGILTAVLLPMYQDWARDGRQEVAPVQNGRVVEREVEQSLTCSGGFLVRRDGQIVTTQDNRAVKC